ncbi:ABC transporter ATP-binding protein [Spirosoma agri]|uniref:ABC transporter ATP-binding protein n=1 Tax=Spirosoma agri TaxID=1987381 RepID=A0A6M0IQJ7_9BACT|nr:ATP-binding cassette domain-containing protein [Spirosoma agri]NEU69651.1 ABC transporter ATP-binding protein [Spirosoma agri]
MEIRAEQVGKKYRKEWIFRRVALTLTAGSSYTFVGPNGSGKSTLLQLLAGSLPLTEGQLSYRQQDTVIEPDNWFRHVNIAAPYLELVEELSLDELLTFHQTFKPFKAGFTPEIVAEQLLLGHARHKEIKYFSSGMKQRVKLGLAFFSEAPIVILDEPTSNLDRQGVAWYQEQVRQLIKPAVSIAGHSAQLLLIGSNQPEEYDFCPNVLNMTQWK